MARKLILIGLLLLSLLTLNACRKDGDPHMPRCNSWQCRNGCEACLGN